MKKILLKKTKKLTLHVGFWSAVSGILLIKFLYDGIFQEKTRNGCFNE